MRCEGRVKALILHDWPKDATLLEQPLFLYSDLCEFWVALRMSSTSMVLADQTRERERHCKQTIACQFVAHSSRGPWARTGRRPFVSFANVRLPRFRRVPRSTPNFEASVYHRRCMRILVEVSMREERERGGYRYASTSSTARSRLSAMRCDAMRSGRVAQQRDLPAPLVCAAAAAATALLPTRARDFVSAE